MWILPTRVKYTYTFAKRSYGRTKCRDLLTCILYSDFSVKCATGLLPISAFSIFSISGFLILHTFSAENNIGCPELHPETMNVYVWMMMICLAGYLVVMASSIFVIFTHRFYRDMPTTLNFLDPVLDEALMSGTPQSEIDYTGYNRRDSPTPVHIDRGYALGDRKQNPAYGETLNNGVLYDCVAFGDVDDRSTGSLGVDGEYGNGGRPENQLVKVDGFHRTLKNRRNIENMDIPISDEAAVFELLDEVGTSGA